MERDPVCGMSVDPNKAAAKVEQSRKTYYFCAPGCAKRFQQAPDKYLGNLEKRDASGFVSLQTAHASGTGTAVAPAAQGAPHPRRHPARHVPHLRHGA